jgi:hypothetical protein
VEKEGLEEPQGSGHWARESKVKETLRETSILHLTWAHLAEMLSLALPWASPPQLRPLICLFNQDPSGVERSGNEREKEDSCDASMNTLLRWPWTAKGCHSFPLQRAIRIYSNDC